MLSQRPSRPWRTSMSMNGLIPCSRWVIGLRRVPLPGSMMPRATPSESKVRPSRCHWRTASRRPRSWPRRARSSCTISSTALSARKIAAARSSRFRPTISESPPLVMAMTWLGPREAFTTRLRSRKLSNFAACASDTRGVASASDVDAGPPVLARFRSIRRNRPSGSRIASRTISSARWATSLTA